MATYMFANGTRVATQGIILNEISGDTEFTFVLNGNLTENETVVVSSSDETEPLCESVPVALVTESLLTLFMLRSTFVNKKRPIAVKIAHTIVAPIVATNPSSGSSNE